MRVVLYNCKYIPFCVVAAVKKQQKTAKYDVIDDTIKSWLSNSLKYVRKKRSTTLQTVKINANAREGVSETSTSESGEEVSASSYAATDAESSGSRSQQEAVQDDIQ